MKTLSQLITDNTIIEGLSKEEAEVFIKEGLFSGLGKLLGWGAGKVQKAANNFSDSFNNAFIAAQLGAAKSDDEKSKKESEEFAKKVKDCKSDKDLLEKYKVYGETLLKTLKERKSPLLPISVKRQLANMGKKLNDDEALELSEKLQKAIDEHWKSDEVNRVEKTLDKTEEKVDDAFKKQEEKSGDDTSGGDSKKGNGDSVEGDGVNKIEQKVKETIKEETDILSPLAKAANLDGKGLLAYITNKLYTLTEPDKSDAKKKVKKYNPNSKDFDNDKFDKLVLGMCITICGAIITKDPNLFTNISKILGIEDKTVNDLKTRIKGSNSYKNNKEDKPTE